MSRAGRVAYALGLAAWGVLLTVLAWHKVSPTYAVIIAAAMAWLIGWFFGATRDR